MLKREVTLYAFNQIASPATAGIGHDIALGGDGNDWIHTGPGEDLANGNAGDDRIFLGDNFTATTAEARPASALLLAHDRVDAGWGGLGYDHVWGGYGADYSDVRPRKAAEVPGLFPASDPETWFQIAGAGPTPGFPPPAQQELSQNEVNYAHGNDNFGDKDYHYGGWDQDTLQANIGDNGPHIGDRMLDWGGSYNGYYLCPSTYGDWVSTRAVAPGLIALPAADGAGRRRDDDRDGGHVGLPRDRDRLRERGQGQHEADPRGHARALHLRAGYNRAVTKLLCVLATTLVLVAAAGCSGDDDGDGCGHRRSTAAATTAEPAVESTGAATTRRARSGRVDGDETGGPRGSEPLGGAGRRRLQAVAGADRPAARADGRGRARVVARRAAAARAPPAGRGEGRQAAREAERRRAGGALRREPDEARAKPHPLPRRDREGRRQGRGQRALVEANAAGAAARNYALVLDITECGGYSGG